jgi:UDP-N-acetyl-2-amino-2-deoxyglucuronate dehydrogenase
MTIRVGILGSGNISATHARAARLTNGVETVAYWGRNAEKAASMAAEHGGAPYGHLEAFLAHRPMDAVIVGTPSGMHAEHALAAARRGLHVLVEKPLDIATARVDALIDECDRASVKLGVIFQDRTAPGLVWLRNLIASGGLGTVFLASARVKWYRPPEYYGGSRWRGTWALDGGGALMNQGIHTVDLLLWLLGDVNRVYAKTMTALHKIEVEDTAIATLSFANGAIGTLEATTSVYPGWPRRVEITGTKGTVVVENDAIVSVELTTPPTEPPPNVTGNANASSSSPIVSDVRGHQRVIEDFARAIEGNTTPLCDGRDGRRSVALVEAAYRSARTGEAETP